MSDQNETERKRRERVNLANAFTRRVWQPSEKNKLSTRLIAGGVALVVVAGAAFGIGALISFQQDRQEKDRQRSTSAHQRAVPLTSGPSPSMGSPSPGRGSPSPGKGSGVPGAGPPGMASGPPGNGPSGRASGGAQARWALATVPTGENFSTVTRVVIRNVMTGMCADIPWYGKGQVDGVIQQYGCNASSGDNQRWDLIVHQRGGGPGGASPFTIRNSTDRLCMDLPGSGAAADRSEVKENNCRSGGDNQMWFLDERSNGRYWIRNLVSGHLCLDVAEEAGSGGEGAKLTIHPCSPSDDHLWSFSS